MPKDSDPLAVSECPHKHDVLDRVRISSAPDMCGFLEPQYQIKFLDHGEQQG